MMMDYHDIERIALAHVLEDENWQKFLEWVRDCYVSEQAHAWLEAGPRPGSAPVRGAQMILTGMWTTDPETDELIYTDFLSPLEIADDCEDDE